MLEKGTGGYRVAISVSNGPDEDCCGGVVVDVVSHGSSSADGKEGSGMEVAAV